MWDQETALRVRERKMAEMGKIVNYTNEDRKAKLLGELGRDVCICNCTVSGNGVCVIPSTPIADPGYLSALSEQAMEDEKALDSVRISPPHLFELLSEAFRMAAETASEDRAAPYKEALEAVKEELTASRDMVDRLSASLEYAKSQSEAAECQCKELKETVDRLEAELKDARTARNVDKSASCPMNAFRRLVESIKDMKLSAMDIFIDEALSGSSDADLCDEVVVMLKHDIEILDSLSASETEIQRPVPDSSQSKNALSLRNLYESRLDEDGRVLEGCFRRLTTPGS